MTDSGPVRPRRAMEPLPTQDEGESPTETTGGSRALPFDPDWRSDEAETQVLRRVILPSTPDSAASPASPASPPGRGGRGWAPTPVPPPPAVPPKPVLPAPTASLQASAGRRFSASASPSEFTSAAPRRSAASVSSPPSAAFEPSRGPAVEFEPATPVGASPPPEPPAGPAAAATAAAPRKRGRGRALAVLAIVVAIATVVAGAVWWFVPRDSPAANPTTPTSPSPSVSLDPVLTASDLTTLSGSPWTEATAATATDPICLPAGVETMPAPDRTSRRTLTSAANPSGTVTHVVDTYPDVAAATRAYQARLQQAGTCADTAALVVSAATVSGLADAAFGARIDAQDDPIHRHSLIVSRTGRNLSMVDVGAAEPVELKDVAAVAAKPLARLCSGGEGACPTAAAKVTATIPAAGQYPGWLIEADLPRITAGAGRWGPTEPSPTLTIIGSQCEAVGLVKVADTSASAQRTLLLADDPIVPAGFGIDQVVYTFTSEKAAKTFADKLNSNLGKCPDRVPTASVDNGPTSKGVGADGVAHAGKSYLVTQKTANDSVQFRVGVVRVGDRVAYLLANPSGGVDFSDSQWKAIMTRTGQRVSQMP